jgi:hypothetical protein
MIDDFIFGHKINNLIENNINNLYSFDALITFKNKTFNVLNAFFMGKETLINLKAFSKFS